ncbi:RNA ligase partner protein [Candidatus Micrarchaeota archaeon]|nr:RNA ligase partner protein [Candidatus Micrarchaeota archaeon]
MKTQRFVLDTSAFTGVSMPKAGIDKRILKIIKLITEAKQNNVTCYCPPSVWNELRGILENKKIPAKEIKKLDAWLVQKTPSLNEINVPAEFLYAYVGEVRERFNRGLREAEKAVLAKGGNRPDDIVIRDLRENYKKSMRQGILDSIEDLEVLLLAKELNAGVVTGDEGIKKWAKKWGIRLLDHKIFPELLQEYMKKGGKKK